MNTKELSENYTEVGDFLLDFISDISNYLQDYQIKEITDYI